MLCAAVRSRVTGLVSIEGKLELGEKKGSPNLDSVATFLFFPIPTLVETETKKKRREKKTWREI